MLLIQKALYVEENCKGRQEYGMKLYRHQLNGTWKSESKGENT